MSRAPRCVSPHAARRALAVFTLCAAIGPAIAPLTGCAADAPASKDPAAAAQALRGRWELVSLGGKPVEANTAKGERLPDLAIADGGAITGFTGVNSFTGALDADALAKGAFKAGPLATTRRAATPGLMDLERRYLDALTNADGYAVSDSDLRLLRGKDELAKLRR